MVVEFNGSWNNNHNKYLLNNDCNESKVIGLVIISFIPFSCANSAFSYPLYAEHITIVQFYFSFYNN